MLIKAATMKTKKWRGTYNAFIPQEGTQFYDDNLIRFKTTMANFEESNPGFHWDWDEKKLVNKYIGIIYREKEFRTNDGEIITITEPCGFRSVDAIRNAKFKVPPIKKLPTSSAPTATNYASFVPVVDDDSELPF